VQYNSFKHQHLIFLTLVAVQIQTRLSLIDVKPDDFEKDCL